MNAQERRQKLDDIFRIIGTRAFAAIARKEGLDIPLSSELIGTRLSTFLSDNITEGLLYDDNTNNQFVNDWYNSIFNKEIQEMENEVSKVCDNNHTNKY